MAVGAGFDGLQLLPLRGWRKAALYAIPKQLVCSFEGPWNKGPLLGALKRHLHLAGEEQPLLMDWLFFGPSPLDAEVFAEMFPKALRVSHTSNGQDLYEINPELGPPTRGEPVCWDTKHTRRGRRDRKPNPLKQWRDLLAELDGSQIKLIHFNPTNRKELTRFLDGKDTELESILRAVARKSGAPIVVETAPLSLSRAGTIELLWLTREKILWAAEEQM
jgi:hypothetical protein